MLLQVVRRFLVRLSLCVLSAGVGAATPLAAAAGAASQAGWSEGAVGDQNREDAGGLFAGTWIGHGRWLDVRDDGSVSVVYRVYNWCAPGAPRPCDDIVGNEIVNGGRMELWLDRVAGARAYGEVVSASDPAFGAGTPAILTLLSGSVVDMTIGVDDQEFGLFCGSDAPPGYCGA